MTIEVMDVLDSETNLKGEVVEICLMSDWTVREINRGVPVADSDCLTPAEEAAFDRMDAYEAKLRAMELAQGFDF